MPLLNYYYAGDVPVYATASVYGGSANPLKDKDLDGIIFATFPGFSHIKRARETGRNNLTATIDCMLWV